MRRYLAIGAAGVTAIVWYALSGVGYAYERTDGQYALPAGCGPHLVTAVQSVYPGVTVSTVQSWGCERVSICTNEDVDGSCLAWSHNKAKCEGTYHKVLTAAQWWANVQADGFGAWIPVAVDRAAGTVTVVQRTPSTILDAAQVSAHANLLQANCLLDHDNVNVPWGEMNRFLASRSNGIVLQVWYADETSDLMDVAEAARDGWALRPLVE